MDHKKTLVPKKNDQISLSRQLILPIRRMARVHRTTRLGSTRKWINDFDRKSDTVIVDTIVPDKRVPEQRSAAIFSQETLELKLKISIGNRIFRVRNVEKTTATKNVSCVRLARAPALSLKVVSMFEIKLLIPNKAFTMVSIGSAHGFV